MILAKITQLFYILEKQETFWDKLKQELIETAESFLEFFIMIKEVTYDPMVDKIGYNATNILLIMIGALLLMIILSKVIQR